MNALYWSGGGIIILNDNYWNCVSTQFRSRSLLELFRTYFETHLEFCCLMKVSCTNAFSDQVPIITTRHHFTFLWVHNFLKNYSTTKTGKSLISYLQLSSNFSNFSHSFGMNEMFSTPGITIFMVFPLWKFTKIFLFAWILMKMVSISKIISYYKLSCV